MDDLQTLIEEFENQEKLYSNEGLTGVKNLCRIVNAMGYEDLQHFGQFHTQGSFGDLIYFLEDNPGCVEAIKEWIAKQDVEDWKEGLTAQLDEVPPDYE